jgi:hypothetical protein
LESLFRVDACKRQNLRKVWLSVKRLVHCVCTGLRARMRACVCSRYLFFTFISFISVSCGAIIVLCMTRFKATLFSISYREKSGSKSAWGGGRGIDEEKRRGKRRERRVEQVVRKIGHWVASCVVWRAYIHEVVSLGG